MDFVLSSSVQVDFEGKLIFIIHGIKNWLYNH